MPDETDQNRNKAAVRQLFEELFQQADVDALDHLVASEVVDHDPVPDQRPGSRVSGMSSAICTAPSRHHDLSSRI